jgi:hypothetical protein
MKLTNRLNLPEPFVRAVSEKTYDNQGSWRTITELIGPPKIAHLKRKHEHEIEVDASELVYTFQGEIAHALVERAAKTMCKQGWLSEQRLFTEVEGKKISGAYDLYNPKTGELIDVKNSTAYKAKKGQAPEEWIQQTNLLAYLLRQAGSTVKSIRILLVVRDFSKQEARRNPDYPQNNVLFMEVPIWEDDKSKAYLHERVRLHIRAETTEVECSPEERWAKPTIWAIKKRGQSRAITGGLFADERIAKDKLAELGSGYEIEHRPGANTRCELYCPVAKFCAQYQKTLTRQGK